MLDVKRRYDIDWLRVIALFLLIFYHTAIIFHEMAYKLLFIQSDTHLNEIWPVMGLINIWRIPLLFFISGMGIFFAMKKRNNKQLILERSRRILIPLVFGALCIVPLQYLPVQKFYFSLFEISYWRGPSHLWFLINIFSYVLIALPLFIYFKKNPENIIIKISEKVINSFFGIYLFIIPIIILVITINPEYFSLFYMNIYGFVMGLCLFTMGFLFVLIDKTFFHAVKRTRYISLITAIILYSFRLILFELEGPNYLTAIESMCWIFTMFGFAVKYLNKDSTLIRYLNEAVFPVYILHLLLMNIVAAFLLTPPMSATIVSTIAEIKPNSIAAEADLLAGDKLVNFNYERLYEEGFDSIVASRQGKVFIVDIDVKNDKELGMKFETKVQINPLFSQTDRHKAVVFFRFLVINILTLLGCFLIYEYLIRRYSIIRPLFGLKNEKKKSL